MNPLLPLNVVSLLSWWNAPGPSFCTLADKLHARKNDPRCDRRTVVCVERFRSKLGKFLRNTVSARRTVVKKCRAWLVTRLVSLKVRRVRSVWRSMVSVPLRCRRYGLRCRTCNRGLILSRVTVNLTRRTKVLTR